MNFAEDQAILQVAERHAKKEIQIIEYLRARPKIDFLANRALISEYLADFPATEINLNRAAAALQLARKSERALEQEAEHQAAVQAQAESDERAELIQIIAQDYSPDAYAQQLESHKLQRAKLDYLRQRAQDIQDKKRYRAMTVSELRDEATRLRKLPRQSQQQNVSTIRLENME